MLGRNGFRKLGVLGFLFAGSPVAFGVEQEVAPAAALPESNTMSKEQPSSPSSSLKTAPSVPSSGKMSATARELEIVSSEKAGSGIEITLSGWTYTSDESEGEYDYESDLEDLKLESESKGQQSIVPAVEFRVPIFDHFVFRPKLGVSLFSDGTVSNIGTVRLGFLGMDRFEIGLLGAISKDAGTSKIDGDEDSDYEKEASLAGAYMQIAPKFSPAVTAEFSGKIGKLWVKNVEDGDDAETKSFDELEGWAYGIGAGLFFDVSDKVSLGFGLSYGSVSLDGDFERETTDENSNKVKLEGSVTSNRKTFSADLGMIRLKL
jgi:opacity protein-like surface antigen